MILDVAVIVDVIALVTVADRDHRGERAPRAALFANMSFPCYVFSVVSNRNRVLEIIHVRIGLTGNE
jgi:hypothetical protein